MSVKQVLDCANGLLLYPDMDDALDSKLENMVRTLANTSAASYVYSLQCVASGCDYTSHARYPARTCS